MSKVYFGFSVLSMDSKSRRPCDGERRSFSGRFLGDVNDVDIADARQTCSLEDNVDVIVQPILKKRVRNADIKGLVVVLDELGGLKPGVVALLINFLFDDIENLLPSIHWLVT